MDIRHVAWPCPSQMLPGPLSYSGTLRWLRQNELCFFFPISSIYRFYFRDFFWMKFSSSPSVVTRSTFVQFIRFSQFEGFFFCCNWDPFQTRRIQVNVTIPRADGGAAVYLPDCRFVPLVISIRFTGERLYKTNAKQNPTPSKSCRGLGMLDKSVRETIHK